MNILDQDKVNERRALVREYNQSRTKVQALSKQLEKLEAHEGDDGIAEDHDAQVALVDEIAALRRRIADIHKTLYPK